MRVRRLRHLDGWTVVEVPHLTGDGGSVTRPVIVMGPAACRGAALIRARRILRAAGELDRPTHSPGSPRPETGTLCA